MSIGAIFIGIAMLVIAIPIVINPVIKASRKEEPGEVIEGLSAAADRHDETLLALRDLEFDHQVGKITEEDYADLRAALMVTAAAALEEQEKQEAELDARLEQAIRLRREKQSKSILCSQCGSILDPSDRFCRSCGTPMEVTCPKCGGKLYPTDLFCNSCGAAIPALKTPAPVEGST